MKLFLTGFMGAGKSAVGSRLAGRMGMDFVDLDRAIEAKANMPVAQVFESRGEAHFRRLEHEALRALSADDRDLVIATGGGTPVSRRNMDLMRASGICVWLDPPFESILSRLDDEERSRRPLLRSSAEARALLRARRPAYAAADIRVRPGADETPDETARKILESVSELPSGSNPAHVEGPDRR